MDGLQPKQTTAPPTDQPDAPRWVRDGAAKPPPSTDLKTLPGVVQSDLDAGAWTFAYDRATTRCYFCGDLLEEFAVPIVASIDRDRTNHGIYPYMSNARIVPVSAFSCFACVVRKAASGDASAAGTTGILGDEK